MKKVLRITLIIALMLVMLLVLTGCGKDKQEENKQEESKTTEVESIVENIINAEDKIVATKTTESEDMEGNPIQYEENIEVSFKNDKVDLVKMIYIFDEEATAEQYVTSYNAVIEFAKAFQEEGAEEISLPTMQLDGKKAIMELDAKEFEEFSESDDEEMTKEAIRQSLEEEGYTIQ